MLFETIVYIAVLMILIGLALTICFRAMDNASALRAAADDIGRTLNIGELWREDIRHASGAVKLTDSDGRFALEIPQAAGTVEYRSDGNRVLRKASQSSHWVPVLGNVKRASIRQDTGRQIKSWRWEIELETRSPRARVRPLFTFQAVPGREINR
ncbi:MAG: hypothetical protein H7X97_00885 [Opitutaceae bacterium]|nr:hypothetical protein [Verrucomicrobiales bacterium]